MTPARARALDAAFKAEYGLPERSAVVIPFPAPKAPEIASQAQETVVPKPARRREFYPLCDGPECLREGRLKGLCRSHYAQFIQGKELTPLREYGSTEVQCRVKECTRKIRARKLCGTHYERQYRKAKRAGKTSWEPDFEDWV